LTAEMSGLLGGACSRALRPQGADFFLWCIILEQATFLLCQSVTSKKVACSSMLLKAPGVPWANHMEGWRCGRGQAGCGVCYVRKSGGGRGCDDSSVAYQVVPIINLIRKNK
jgi:hypothetical protein